jgi:aminoglycoside 3-N-acetyltransferase
VTPGRQIRPAPAVRIAPDPNLARAGSPWSSPPSQTLRPGPGTLCGLRVTFDGLAASSSTWTDEAIALAEVTGRIAFGRFDGLKRRVRRWVRRPASEPQAIGLPEVRAAILELGYEPGRDLLVHSALIRQLQGDLDDVIAMLRDLVGPAATLLMPSHPILFERDGRRIYDVKKSRSRVGMLTERFRRTPGVQRSPFPIAPICALGPAAAEYTRDFREQSAGTPYGVGSPYHEIGERQGQVLYLGIDFIRSVTLEHVAFDVLQGQHPVDDFYEPHEIVVARDGREETWHVRDHRKALEARLATFTMKRLVLRSGTIRRRDVRGVEIGVMDARGFLRWHRPIAQHRGWPYWTMPWARP